MRRVEWIRLFIGAAAAILTAAGLGAQDFLAAGGNGRSGGDGGQIEFRANRGIRAGGKAKVKAPKIPALRGAITLIAADLDVSGAIRVADLDASPGDLDPDDFEVTTAGHFTVLLGTTLELEADVVITSTSGGIFVLGAIQDNDGNDDGVDLTLRSIRRQVVVTGAIDVDGETAADGGDAGDIDLIGLQVAAGGTATISARGGSTTGGGDGGAGGNLTIENFTPVVQEKKVFAAFGSGTTVDLRGGDGNAAGNGGDLEINFADMLGNRSAITLTGSIDVRGGSGSGGGGSGGNGGNIDGDAGGNIGLTGSFDASGGAGDVNANGGDGGRIRFGNRPGAGFISILGDLLTPGVPVSVTASGGAGAVTDGGAGGSLEAESDQGPIAWVGSIGAAGGASDNDGAEGGAIFFTAWGSKKANITLTGNLDVSGSDAGPDTGAGSPGGDVEIISLDGAVAVTGDIDASAGDADGAGNDADPLGGGHVYLVVDDASGDPDTAANSGGIDLLDNRGLTVIYSGSLTTDGGAGGGGDSDGSSAGEVVIDSDGDDGEQKTNGGGILRAVSVISAAGGNGSGTGLNGDGGNVTLRASNRGNVAITGFAIEAGATVGNNGGAGGTGGGGAAGTDTFD